MDARLCFLCCGNFRPELAAAIAAEGWADVGVFDFPTRCGRPPVDWNELRALLPADCGGVVVFGRACLQGLGEAPAEWPASRVVGVRQCFHIVAGETLVDEAIAGGAYLITPAWLADWRGQVAAMGFAPEQAGEFFREFARELLLLDTGTDPRAPALLAELAECLRLPVRRLVVGLDTVRARLARLVLEWRLERVTRQAQADSRRGEAERADQQAAMDMLSRLARTQDEEAAIAAIRDLMQMLFAPAALHYLRLESGVAQGREAVPQALQAALLAMPGDYAWTPDGAGFMLRIANPGGEALGLLAVDGLAFPDYRQRYLNMALALIGVCGLAIDNARNRKRLVEAQKMASLAIMVAGVAHEINTPLGVGLAAASTLQLESRQLAGHFAARSMTQSELTRYLETAASSTALIRSNLERIGHLVDAFRQVAVEGRPAERRRFRLRACLDAVIASFGDRLAAAGVTLVIDCDPELAISDVESDWASIFTNLIGNSLKHGFRGRERGRIEVAITPGRGRLCLDYHDDGVGMAAPALARVFDPFYTTDLQQGMGLGMHLVYNLVTHRLGGSIVCDSSEGRGAHFRIDLPLPEEAAR